MRTRDDIMTAQRKTLPFEPAPIHVRLAKGPLPGDEDPHGPWADATAVMRVWITSEARRCKLCLPEHCTLKPIASEPHIATCVQVVTGDVSPGSAASLRLD